MGKKCPTCQGTGRAPTATGPQRSEAERPNPETDGLVTVELTREEAEVLLLGDHVVDCEAELTALSDSATAKIRASLERTGK